MNVYDFSAQNFDLSYRPLSDYRGKVLLIVNTASKCYFSKQFKTLELLYNRYKNQGFEILGFPSNDFRNQEPLTGRTLETHCRINQRVTFPIFKRIHVIGQYQDPLYKYLSDKSLNGMVDSNPKWNFHKYLVDRNGEVKDFYYSLTSPLSKKLTKNIELLLAQKSL